MIRLEYQYKGNQYTEGCDEKTIMELADDIAWPAALDAFERFLKLTGYVFDAKFVEGTELWEDKYGEKDDETA